MERSGREFRAACPTHPFLVVGDDAAHEVGVGVSESGHELGQLLLVELADCAEHALLGFVRGAEGRLVHPGHLVQAHDPIHCGREGRNTVRWVWTRLHGQGAEAVREADTEGMARGG